MKAILSAMAAPGDSDPVRFVSPFTSQASALAKPFERLDVGWGTTGAGGVPATDAVAFAFRDPVRANVIYDGNSGNVQSAYAYQFTLNNGTTNQFNLEGPMPAYSVIPMDTAYLLPLNSYQPHGDVLGVAVTKDDRTGGVWLNSAANDLITLSVNAISGTTPSMYPQLYRWDGAKWQLYLEGTAVSTTGTQNLAIKQDSDRGYYIVKFRNGTANPITTLTVHATLYQSAAVFCHKTLPYLYQKMAAIEEVRVNAYSLMFSNKAALLNLSGKIAAYQSPGSVTWDSWALGGFGQVSSANGAVQLDARNGIYIFGKATMPEDFDYVDAIQTDVGSVSKLAYDLDSTRSYVVIYSEISTTAGQDAYWTRSFGVEFLTKDQWFDVCPPEYSEEMFRQALVLLRDLPAIHENPLHWEDIKNFAKQAVGAVLKYGPTVIDIAKMLV